MKSGLFRIASTSTVGAGPVCVLTGAEAESGGPLGIEAESQRRREHERHCSATALTAPVHPQRVRASSAAG